MLKLLFVIILAVFATTFAMDNMHRVDMGLIVGRAVRVRLFFLLLTSFLIGCFISTLVNIYLNVKSRHKSETSPHDDEDFFTE